MQQKGEHPKCGPTEKLEPSGFSYNPKEFTENRISVLNFPWKPRNLADTVYYLFEICQEAKGILESDQAVLVHCHTGLTRSSFVAAALMLFFNREVAKSPFLIIDSVSQKRSNCISNTVFSGKLIKFYESLKISRN